MTKGKRCDIIDKLSAKERFARIELKDSDRSLKIEQQEMKYKEQEIVQRISKILKENTTQTKVKEQIDSKKDVRCREAFYIPFFREFDPGSGLTLAACITHSSRTKHLRRRLRSKFSMT